MKSLLRVGPCVGCCLVVSCGLSMAASTGHPEFDRRLSEVGLMYSLPSGFVDNGSNPALESELTKSAKPASPFVVHRIHSTDGKMAGYVDVRALGIDLTNQALAISYPIVFRANAEKYCETVTGSSCSVETELSSESAHAEYHADLGLVLEADDPSPARIEGHKRARVFAISKPSKGLFYATFMYDSDEEFEDNRKAVAHMLKFDVR